MFCYLRPLDVFAKVQSAILCVVHFYIKCIRLHIPFQDSDNLIQHYINIMHLDFEFLSDLKVS